MSGVPTAGDAPAVDLGGHRSTDALAELRRHAQQVIVELTAPVCRLRLRLGEAELEVEWDRRAGPQPGLPPDTTAPGVAAPAPRTAADPPVAPPPAVPAARTSVHSPIVGTFYRSPQPGTAPFVAVGDLVRPGQVVGIVEAMKLMNEIVADRPGRVVEILVTDGQPVEYDQPLVVLDPA
ncbi:acetyl-CoA carboxylase biotin carboxyl carrier protein [Micromonospora sp. HNM0581]|uniref:acetyl-CoA carboxylase biotin carboxyl carrier protein n=1 Tax=Micromonospora sp. HNM0581 TaxID=2716341 RepID=UPI00146BFF6C|nr:acetyl-CoA carboxylase biotin carboxyl carrier protein [Micromonospora sp. HNM0581]NLU79744.1 acetyl-CoA carboxylase biotin carboxyl carrier protein [Micromonospora sp. HNM0581]